MLSEGHVWEPFSTRNLFLLMFNGWALRKPVWLFFLWELTFKVAEHSFCARSTVFVADGRQRAHNDRLRKTNMAPIERWFLCSMPVIYFAFFFLKWHCVECFRLLLEWYVRESQDAKSPAIAQVFRRYHENPVKWTACVVGQKIECLSGFLGNAHISQEPLIRISWNLAESYFWEQVSRLLQNIWKLTEKL